MMMGISWISMGFNGYICWPNPSTSRKSRWHHDPQWWFLDRPILWNGLKTTQLAIRMIWLGISGIRIWAHRQGGASLFRSWSGPSLSQEKSRIRFGGFQSIGVPPKHPWKIFGCHPMFHEINHPFWAPFMETLSIKAFPNRRSLVRHHRCGSRPS